MALIPRTNLSKPFGHRLVVAPTVEPVSLAEVRDLLRDPPVSDNSFISQCIVDAREVLESLTGLACITQTWKLTLDNWPNNRRTPWWDGVREMPVTELSSGGIDYVKLPRYPARDISELKTYDLSNDATTVSWSDHFFLDTESYPGRLVLSAGGTWPIALRDQNAVEITYVAGFGDVATAVPGPIRRAIAQTAGYLYENRGTGCSASFSLSQSGALQLISQYTRARL